MQTRRMKAQSQLWRESQHLQLDTSSLAEGSGDGLLQLFALGRAAVGSLRHHCREQSPDGRALFAGQLPTMIEGAKLRGFMHRAQLQHPIHPVAPFEGTEWIAGAAWLAKREFGEDADDGVAKLCFASNTANLPLHTHEQSERFIFCLQGRGIFHYCRTPIAEFKEGGIRCIAMRPGRFVLFSRNLLHTFAAGRPGMVLISYQAPSLPFEDPRQFTLPGTLWTPGSEQLSRATSRRLQGHRGSILAA